MPTTDSGSASDGISVADMLRRKMKITITTSAAASVSVNWTSAMPSRIDCERSYRTFMLIAAGSCSAKDGSSFLTAFTTSIVLVPGWRWIARMTERSPLNQLATLLSSTLSTTRPI